MRVFALPSVDGVQIAEERMLAGRLAGALYLTAGVTAFLLLVMPGVDVGVPAILVICAVGGILVGFAEVFLVPWQRTSAWVAIASSGLGLPLTALAMSQSGGAHSPTRFYLLFFVIFCSYFYVRREALILLAACAPVLLSPLLYQPGVLGDGYLAELVVLVPIYGVLGFLVMSAKSLQLELRERATALSLTDPLTGVANRRAFETAMASDGPMEGRAADRTGLILVDIDDFKQANTLLGHKGGDDVLRAVAAALREVARGNDVVARLGGDEFAILATDISAQATARLAERVLEAVDEAGAHAEWGSHHQITISAGWAAFPEPVSDRGDLYVRADHALAEAKLAGKAEARGWRDGAGRPAPPASDQATSRSFPVSTS